MEFKIGTKVEVKLSRDWVMILAVKGNEITCRTKNNEVITFYDFELKEINS